jgi:protease PrsW
LPEPPLLIPALLLGGIPTLVYLAVLNAIDRYEKEPWTILLACVLGGAVVAPVVVVGALAILGRPSQLTPSLAPGAGGADPLVAVLQEFVKGAVLVVLIRSVRSEFDDALDGIIYGAAVGAGFAATETIVYAAGGTAGLEGSTIATLLLSGLNHAFYGAVLGAVLGAARRLPTDGQAAVAAAYGFLTAGLLHALHDSLPAILARILDRPDAALGLGTRLLTEAVNLLGLITLAFAVWFAWRREARVVQDQLREEVESGVVSAADYAALPSTRRRLAAQVATARSGGVRRALTVRRLFALEGELAFHKVRLATRRHHRPDARRTAELRAEIARLRAALEDGPR